MNVKSAIAVAALLVFGATACTTMDERDNMARAPSQGAWLSEADRAYVDKVERIARRRGIDVMWVHYPRTKQSVAQTDD